jgi:hypothetical protein
MLMKHLNIVHHVKIEKTYEVLACTKLKKITYYESSTWHPSHLHLLLRRCQSNSELVIYFCKMKVALHCAGTVIFTARSTDYFRHAIYVLYYL